MSEQKTGLRKAVTLRYAVAMYMSSVLGSGILILPGLTGQLAGPASLIAWALLSFASYPMAYTFANLSAQKPESGGIYSFAKDALGLRTAQVSGWLFLLWYVTGAPAVTLIAASYLAYVLPISQTAIYLVAGLILVGPFLINYRGITVSGKVQLAVIISIVALLVTTVIASSPSVRLGNFSPFFPLGFLPIGVSAALIFWSYLGYENVSNIAEEFKDPKRDFHRSVVLSVLLISGLYFAVALVTVGTRAYEAGGSVAPFAVMLSNVLGVYGAAGTALLAVFIIFGTVNAYTAGMSRVIYATARDGGFPSIFARIHEKTKVPHYSLALLFSTSWVMIIIFYIFKVDLQTALLIPSGGAILLYVIGSITGIRFLKEHGVRKTFPWISLIASLIMLPFVGILLSASLVVALLGLLYSRWSWRRRRTANS